MAALQAPLEEPAKVQGEVLSLQFPRFDADVAWVLGSQLRTRLLALSPKPAVINISLANSTRVVFHAVTRPGASADNDVWVARKRATVLRWGQASWYFSRLFREDADAFKEKYELGERAGEYSIHGGGVPVFVRGVEGPVGVVVVSGLKQGEDHQVVVETVREYLRSVGA